MMKKQRNKYLITTIIILIATNLLFLFLLLFLPKEKAMDEMSEFNAESALEIGEEEGIELIPEAETGRKMDSIDEMSAEELKEYLSEYAYYYYGKNTNIRNIVENELDYYIPQNNWWNWTANVVTKEGNDFILQLKDNGYAVGLGMGYEAQIRIRPDFTVELIEDSIKVRKKEIGFCVYKSDREYIYHGSKIVEYYGERYNKEHDIHMEVILPLFSNRESDKWDEMNKCILEGVEKWLDEEADYQGGKVTLDYEITTLDENIYSIHFSGQHEESNKKEDVEFGMTIAVNSENLLPKSVFTTVKEDSSFFDYYIEDDTLFLLVKEKDCYVAQRDREVDFLSYDIVREERNVIDANGKTIGRYYYEIPEIRTPTFGAVWIIKKMKEDKGRFFNELAKEFEETLFYLDEEIEYAISWDFWEMGIQNSYRGPYCYVDCEVICNNGEIFGVKYHYWLWLDKVGCKGEAVAIYNINEEVVEYEDWQSTVLEEIRNITFEKKQED